MKFLKCHQKIATGILLLGISCFINAFALDSNKSSPDAPAALNPKQQAILKVLLPSLSPLPAASKKSSLEVPKIDQLTAPMPIKDSIAPSLNALENPAIGQNPPTMVGDLEPFHSAKGTLKDTTKEVPIMMQSLVLIGSEVHTQWVTRFSAKPYYQVESDVTHQVLTLTFDNIDPRSLLPPLEIENSSILRIDFSYNTDRQFVIRLTLKPMIDVQGLRVMGDHPTEFVMDLSAGSLIDAQGLPNGIRHISSTGPYRPLVKTPSRYDIPEERREGLNHEYDHAMALLSQNQTPEAQRILIKILKKSPEFEKAYVTLAETYLEENQSQKALSLLLASPLANQPNDQNLSEHVDYYTVLAESYRQSGRAQFAAQIYQALLNFGPDNSVWWVGLGMSLDAMGQKEAANIAFKKAKNLGNLPSTLNQYLAEKS